MVTRVPRGGNTLVLISAWLRDYGLPDTAHMSATTLDDTTDPATLTDYHQLLCDTGSHEAVLQALLRLPLAMQRIPMAAAAILRLAFATAHSGMLEHNCPPPFTMWAATAREASHTPRLRYQPTAVGRRTTPPVGNLEHLLHDVTVSSTDLTVCTQIEAISRTVRLEALVAAGSSNDRSTWMALKSCLDRLPEESRNIALSPANRLRQLLRDLTNNKLMEHPVPPDDPWRKYVLHLVQYCINSPYAFGRQLGGNRAVHPTAHT